MKDFHDITKEELLLIKVWLEGHIKVSDDLIKHCDADINLATGKFRSAWVARAKTYKERCSLMGTLNILKEQLKDDYGWVEEDGDSQSAKQI